MTFHFIWLCLQKYLPYIMYRSCKDILMGRNLPDKQSTITTSDISGDDSITWCAKYGWTFSRFKPRHTVACSYTIEYIANIVQYLSTQALEYRRASWYSPAMVNTPPPPAHNAQHRDFLRAPSQCTGCAHEHIRRAQRASQLCTSCFASCTCMYVCMLLLHAC